MGDPPYRGRGSLGTHLPSSPRRPTNGPCSLLSCPVVLPERWPCPVMASHEAGPVSKPTASEPCGDSYPSERDPELKLGWGLLLF